MRLDLDLERVRANVRQATTEDLLDRATVYRKEMEPEALEIIDAELRARGISPEQVEEHGRKRWTIPGLFGLPARCRRCSRPASVRAWGWHWLWGLVPLFPWRFAWCDEHRPRGAERGPAVRR